MSKNSATNKKDSTTAMRSADAAPSSDLDNRKLVMNRGLGRGKRKSRTEKGSRGIPRIAKQLSGELGRRIERRRSDKSAKKRGGSTDGTSASDTGTVELDAKKSSRTAGSDAKKYGGTVELDGKKYVARTGIGRVHTKVVPDAETEAIGKTSSRNYDNKRTSSKQMPLSHQETTAATAKLDSLRKDLKTLLASRAHYPMDGAATVTSGGQSMASDLTPLMQNGAHPRRYPNRSLRHKSVKQKKKVSTENVRTGISCASVCVDVLVDNLRPPTITPTASTSSREERMGLVA